MFKKFLLLTIVCLFFYPAQSSASKISTFCANDIVGTYVLIKANNQKLPAVVNKSGDQEVLGGSVLLKPDKTHRWETVYRYTETDGDVRISKSSGTGKYSVEGNRIIFEFDGDNTRLSATLKKGVLVLQTDVELIYKKKF